MSLQRILVCAEPSIAERFAGALRARGYDAETVTDRTTALTLSERTHPEIVLAWSDLPGNEIVGFVQRLGDLSPRPRVAVVVREEDMERCGDLLEVGADALLLDDPEMAFLLSSLHRLRGGGLVVDPSLARALVARAEAGSRASEVAPSTEVEEPPSGSGEGATQVRVVEFQECDLAEIVRTSVAEAALAFPLITVEVHTPPALPAVGEPEALQGVVRILVDLACRRTSSGSSVTVKAKKAVEGLTVSVTTRGSGGNGEEVGLDLARSLVALHGGILWSEPLPAGGTRLLFTLPPKPPALADEEREAAIQALELLAGVGAQPEAAPPDEVEAEAPEVEERVDDLEVLDVAPDELDPILDLNDIRDPMSADETFPESPEAIPSASVVTPDTAEPAELEDGLDEPEPDVDSELVSQVADLDLPLDPLDDAPDSLAEAPPAGQEPERLEDEPDGEATDAEAPAAEVEPAVAGESRLRRRWKHRRPRWKRLGQDPAEQTSDEASQVEPAEARQAPEEEAPSAGEAFEVEPDPAALTEPQAEADETDLDLVPQTDVDHVSQEEPADHPVEVEPAAGVAALSDGEGPLAAEDDARPADEPPQVEPDLSAFPDLEPDDLLVPGPEASIEKPEAPADEHGTSEEEVEVADAETPDEVDAAAETPKPRGKRKHRRLRWGRPPRAARSPSQVERSEEEPPPALEALPGDLADMEPEPAELSEVHAEVEAPASDAPLETDSGTDSEEAPELELPLEVASLEEEPESAELAAPQAAVEAGELDVPLETDTEEPPAQELLPLVEVPAEELTAEELTAEELPPEVAPVEEVLADLQPPASPHDSSELPVEVEAAAEAEPSDSPEGEPEPPPDYEEPEPPTIEIPDPEPVANASAAVGQEKGAARELPPRPFVPDPFDPATQMLRSLALEREDDDLPLDPFRQRRGK